MTNKKFIYRRKKIKDYLSNKRSDIRLELTKKIYYMGFYGVRNWGDAINSELIQLLSGKTGVIIPLGNTNVRKMSYIQAYSFIGSILSGASMHNNLVVYRSGFMSSSESLINEPSEILAVRGKLTAERIQDSIGYCPKCYGDPAVLYKYFHTPQSTKKYRLGIIPHWSDYKIIENMYASNKDVQVIDVDLGGKDFIDEICSCQYIASSSLHGLIMADAYGIPNVWLKMLSGLHPDDFKYYDYYSVVESNREPISLTEINKIDDICSLSELSPRQVDSNKLLRVCPFNKTKQEN